MHKKGIMILIHNLRARAAYFKDKVLLIVIVFVITLILNTSISIWLSKSKNVYLPSIGTLRTINVKVYGGDIKIKDEHQYIDWGIIYPIKKTYRSFYIQSLSNVKTDLELKTFNWIFRDSDGNVVPSSFDNTSHNYLYIEWNCTDAPIEPRQVIFVTLCLHVSSDVSIINYLIEEKITDFSFEIIISAIESNARA